MGPDVEELKRRYDIILIDNPPVGLVTDSIAMIQLAVHPIYIFRADYSKKIFVQNVDRLISENKITRLSVILSGWTWTATEVGITTTLWIWLWIWLWHGLRVRVL